MSEELKTVNEVKTKELGLRYNVGKARWSLVPLGPLSELVNVFTYGSKKYADHNWRKGLKFSDTIEAMERHWNLWKSGEERDVESGCHHLAHVLWNTIVLLEFVLLGRKELDDRVFGAPIQPTTNIKEPPKCK